MNEWMYVQLDRQIDRYIDRQVDIYIDRQEQELMYGWIGRQGDR